MEKPFVCATLSGRTAEAMSDDASRAVEMGADLVEARLDLLWTSEHRNHDTSDVGDEKRSDSEVIVNQLEMNEVDFEDAVKEITNAIDSPLLLACRPQRQGGHFPGTEEERLEVLKAAISCNPSWIDLETDMPAAVREELMGLIGDDTQVIASFHSVNGTPTPSEITQDVLDAKELGTLVKACYATNSRTDALRIFEAALELKSSEINFSLMGIGPGGDWARIHAPMLDQYMVYATTESGWHLAQQGRINVSDLRMAWQVLEYS